MMMYSKILIFCGLSGVAFSAVITGICDNCDMENGEGFQPHPKCNMFYQCSENRNGIEAIEKQCPESLFWNQKIKTCVAFYESDCYKGECDVGSGRSELFPSISNCGLYYNCTDREISRHCCDAATPKFDAETKTCVPSTNCTQCNTAEDETQKQISRPCNSSVYRPHYDENGVLDVCKYTVNVGPTKYILPCGAGTIYNTVRCDCSIRSDNCTNTPLARAINTGACEADFYLPFTNNGLSDPMNGAKVENERVQILDETAIFRGDNRERLFINRYSSNDFALPLAIKIVYNDNGVNTAALLSNGGCNYKPSVYIAVGNGRVTLGVVTENGGYDNEANTSASTSGNNSWKSVIFFFDGMTLTGQVTNLNANLQPISSPVPIPAVTVPKDRIKLIAGALQLGYAYGREFSGFQGRVKELKIWKGCTQLTTVEQYAKLTR